MAAPDFRALGMTLYFLIFIYLAELGANPGPRHTRQALHQEVTPVVP